MGIISGILTSLAATKYLLSGNGGSSNRQTVRVSYDQFQAMMQHQAEVKAARDAAFNASNGGHIVRYVSDFFRYLFYDVNGILFSVAVILIAFAFAKLFKKFYCKFGDCTEWCYENNVEFTVWVVTALCTMCILAYRFLVWFNAPYIA